MHPIPDVELKPEEDNFEVIDEIDYFFSGFGSFPFEQLDVDIVF